MTPLALLKVRRIQPKTSFDDQPSDCIQPLHQGGEDGEGEGKRELEGEHTTTVSSPPGDDSAPGEYDKNAPGRDDSASRE